MKPNNSLLSVFYEHFSWYNVYIIGEILFFNLDLLQGGLISIIMCILCCLLSFSYSKITNCCHLCRRVDRI